MISLSVEKGLFPHVPTPSAGAQIRTFIFPFYIVPVCETTAGSVHSSPHSAFPLKGTLHPRISPFSLNVPLPTCGVKPVRPLIRTVFDDLFPLTEAVFLSSTPLLGCHDDTSCNTPAQSNDCKDQICKSGSTIDQ